MKLKIINTIHIFKEDYNLRTVTISTLSFCFDFFYLCFCIVMSAMQYSAWYSCLIVYHFVTFFLRGIVVVPMIKSRTTEQDPISSVKKYRLCGMILIVLSLILSAMILQIVKDDKTFTYPVFQIYVIAAYTFFRITVAIYNVIRSKKNRSISVRTLISINASCAFVSFLSLQAMALDAFSKNINKAILNAITGMIVCASVIAIGIYMVAVAHKRLKNNTKK